MKIKIFSLLAIVATSFAASISKSNSLNTEGSVSSSAAETVEAVTYALANAMKMDDIYVQNSKDYKDPTIVTTLPVRQPLDGGAPETVEEVPSANEYYDGSKGLKITVTQCNSYTTQPQVCTGMGSCGWCGSTNSCVTGNNLGPLAPCLRGTYKFSAPSSDWNPISTKDVAFVNQNVAGASITRVISNK